MEGLFPKDNPSSFKIFGFRAKWNFRSRARSHDFAIQLPDTSRVNPSYGWVCQFVPSAQNFNTDHTLFLATFRVSCVRNVISALEDNLFIEMKQYGLFPGNNLLLLVRHWTRHTFYMKLIRKVDAIFLGKF